MKVIWKFGLSIEDKQIIDIPKGAKILTVQIQHGVPCFWAICDTHVEFESRQIRIVGTGHEHETIEGQYIGTVQQANGNLIWHVFII